MKNEGKRKKNENIREIIGERERDKLRLYTQKEKSERERETQSSTKFTHELKSAPALYFGVITRTLWHFLIGDLNLFPYRYGLYAQQILASNCPCRVEYG